MRELIEVRWHGLGGMGAVTSADLFASAAISEGKFAQSFPSFGIERRGAPVVAFLRIADQFIRTRNNITTPDVIIVFTPNLFNQIGVLDGLKDSGKLIVNSSKLPNELKSELKLKGLVFTVNASRIAMETIKLPIYNTAMMGALQKATKTVKMESLEAQIRARFGDRADSNIEAMRIAYSQTAKGD